ncbi:MAG: thiamine pyrophosphate-binding protein [Candidatus Tectomicrobia bacterium]|nr:thiamine pyrophosphate-binding protein [Candidatus Tectomicrobia bacterium]
MKRYECMKVLAPKLKDELLVLPLGGTVDEWYNAAPHMRRRSWFHQHLGTVSPVAFGLSMGLPHRKVIALDTDGGLLLNLGIIATLGNERPENLAVIVWDNESYLSIGGPPTHTAGRTDLAGIARACGIDRARTVSDLEAFGRACEEALRSAGPHFIVAKVEAVREPGLARKHADGREHKYLFVRHIEENEGITIMGPSEHN